MYLLIDALPVRLSGSPGERVIAIAAGWRQTLRDKARARATRRILEALDDRTLRDIGIHRTEIASVVTTRCRGRVWPDYDLI